MITCPACSLQLPATARFCGRCGTALAPAPAAPQDTTALPAADPTQVFSAPLAPADPVFAPVDQQFEPDPPAQPTAPAPVPAAVAAAAQPQAFPGPPTGPAFTGPPPPAQGGPLPGGPPPRRRSSLGLVLGIIGGVLALLIAAGVGITLYVGNQLSDTFNQVASQATSTPQAEPTPGGTADETPYTPPGDTVEDTPSDTPSDSPTTDDVTPLTVPAGGKMCDTDPSGSAYATAATGNDHTSCEFASAVRDAYESMGGDGSSMTLTAHSPVTDKDYDMTCEASPGVTGTGPVTCTGGNDAVVLLGTKSSPGAN